MFDFDHACAGVESEAPRFVTISKPGGGERTLTVLGSEDDARYSALVAPLVGWIERSLRPSVFANRVAHGSGVRLAPMGRSWRAFESARRRLAATSPVILRTDVRDCYGSIAPQTAAAALVAIGAPADRVAALSRALKLLQDQEVRGLPVGPDPSAVLANAVLRVMDEELTAERCPHVRWVDDVWAGAGSRRHAERALTTLRRSLGRIGLELNEEKTQIFSRAEARGDLTGARSSAAPEWA